MIVPKNGRIIILDDKPEQAQPLIRALSKNRIPFTYHTGDKEQLPEIPYDDVRLIFIDINLTDGTNEETIKSQLQRTLTHLVKPKNIYVAAIWSMKENEYENLLDELFNNKIAELRPIIRISLSKNDFFTIDPDTGNYIEDPAVHDIVEKINERLENKLQGIQSLKVLMKWENLIAKCSSETICQFSNIIERNSYWNDNIRHLFYKMAHSYLGKNIVNASEKQIIQAALQILNSSFIDKMENCLNISDNMPGDIDVKRQGLYYHAKFEGAEVKLKWSNLKKHIVYINGTEKAQTQSIEKLKENSPSDKPIIDLFKKEYGNIFPKLNAELLFSNIRSSQLRPGNIYVKVVSGIKKRRLLCTYFKDIDKKQGNRYVIQDISNFKFVELECTPSCDFSQDKWLRSRILPGIIFPISSGVKLCSSDSFYRDIHPFLYNGIISRLIFDFRLFKSINRNDKNDISKHLLFRLKTEVLIDIQAKVSSHINRPGITTIV